VTAHFYCPHCWREVEENSPVCSACGNEIQHSWESKDFVEKLIAALNHPEPTTPVRVAMLLGEIKDARGVGPLITLASTSGDVFIVQAAVRALGEIQTPDAETFLSTMLQHPAMLIRAEAKECLMAIATKQTGSPMQAQSNSETISKNVRNYIFSVLYFLDRDISEFERHVHEKGIDSVLYKEENNLTDDERNILLQSIAAIKSVLTQAKQDFLFETEVHNIRKYIGGI
jgi:hypothetical protein